MPPTVAPVLERSPTTRASSSVSATSLRLLRNLVVGSGALWIALELLRSRGAAGVLGEGGPIELAQVALLGLGAAVLAFGVGAHPAREALVHVALVASAALVRELDGPLDALAHGAWKVPAAGIGLVLVARAIRRRRELRAATVRLVRSPSFGLLFAAATLVFVQSRLLGMQSVWREALGDAYARDLPRLIEELVELAGYGLFLVTALELRAEARSHRRTRSRERPRS